MNSKSTQILFQKYRLGDLTLSNRFALASMTRRKCDPKTLVPSDLNVTHYVQRSSAGLILTESAPISNNAQSYVGNGGIFTSEQVQGWKRVTDAVHSKGSKIFVQLWHAGRVANPALIGEQNVAPSAIKIDGDMFPGVPHQTPKALTIDEIKKILNQFKQGALNAKQAGFDGVELHGATGFLVDQFLRESANERTDKYGGSVENRARFCLEALDLLIEVYGASRVGIKLSPVNRHNDMYDSNPLAVFSYLLKELERRRIAYVQLVEPGDEPSKEGQVEAKKQMPNVCKALRPYFKGTIIINNGLTPESAAKAILDGDADLASFARLYVGNPDLVERVKNDWPLTQPDYTTLFKGVESGEVGYNDYPFHKAEKKTSGGFFACFGKSS